MSVVATSPVKGNSLWAHLVGNCQLAPIIRALSGIPLNILAGTDASATPNSAVRNEAVFLMMS